MTEADVVTAMRKHLEGCFPKTCSSCGREYASFREYVESTTHAGSAMPYDADMGNWMPLRPIGTLTYSHCDCGNTMALSSEGMPLVRLWTLLAWAQVETVRRRMTPRELLNYLRDRICEQVLADK